MTLASHLCLICGIVLGTGQLPPVRHAPPATQLFAAMDAAKTLNTLFQRMCAIGETSGNVADWDAAGTTAPQTSAASSRRTPGGGTPILCYERLTRDEIV